jgi:hypothetical protein
LGCGGCAAPRRTGLRSQKFLFSYLRFCDATFPTNAISWAFAASAAIHIASAPRTACPEWSQTGGSPSTSSTRLALSLSPRGASARSEGQRRAEEGGAGSSQAAVLTHVPANAQFVGVKPAASGGLRVSGKPWQHPVGFVQHV